MTKIDLPHGTTRSSDMSSEVRYAWQGDTLTEHDLGTDGGTMSWKLWRDDEVHAMWDVPGETEIDLENDIALINGRAYGIEVSADRDNDVPLALIVPAEIPSPAPNVPGFPWSTLVAMMLKIDSGLTADAERDAHTARPETRAAMLALIAEATRLLATAEEQTPDAPLVIDPRINGLFYVTAGGLPAVEIHAGRGSDPEIYTITEDGEYVRLPR